MWRRLLYNPFLLLFVFVAFLFVAGDGLRILQYPPRSVHVFRQSDCLAYTRNYYQHNYGFWQPATYNLLGKDGRVVSEFPILYYLAAKLCQVFGFHFSIVRGVTAFCYLLGLLYLFLCVRLWVKDVFLSLFPVLILASSPYFFYYAVNFLPNVPALCLSFAGLYHMLQYGRTKSLKQLAVATLYFAVSVMLKPTDGGLIWVAYGCWSMLQFVKHKTDLRSFLPLIISYAFVALSLLLWLLFVRHYNAVNGNYINLQGFYPMWEMRLSDVLVTFTYSIYELWRDSYQHYLLLLLSLVLLIVYVRKWRSVDSFLRTFTLLLLLGCLVYTPLWFKAFMHHDYYQLIFAVPAFFVCVTVLTYFEKHVLAIAGKGKKAAVYCVLLFLVLVSIFHNQTVQLERYSDRNIGYVNPHIYEAEPFLRKLGIKESDIVLSVPDNSPNITLAAYGNKGYANDLFVKNAFGPRFSIAHGAKYMIICDGEYNKSSVYGPYTRKLLGVYEGIYVYDLR